MQRRVSIICVCLGLACSAIAQQVAQQQGSQVQVPGTPEPRLQQRDLTVAPANQVVIINGRLYQRPTQRQFFHDYLIDSYGLPAIVRSSARTAYNQGLDQPHGWGQDGAGLAQRFASNLGITTIGGTVRYGMEELFHEDLRYIPCHGCGIKHKLENALLAEITARHDTDGHRFFTLTPTVADYSGPVIARYAWYPPGSGRDNPFYTGLIGTRTVVATRVGAHLFREFVLERRHRDPREAVPSRASKSASH